MTKTKALTLIEFTAFFIVTPSVMYFYATRWNVHIALWLASAYALFRVWYYHKPKWRDLWHGVGWKKEQKKAAALRFALSTVLIFLLTQYLAPERMLTFPMLRPGFWLLVMVVYPILSALPQELIFRSFFFRRYETLFHTKHALIVASAVAFAFMHIVFHNYISPSLCLIAGGFFAYSYSQHRSLKWALAEHAAYGCMVFTVGIGFYFLVGGGSRL